MFKCLALISILVLCKADDYYQMSINHDSSNSEYKTSATEHNGYSHPRDLKVESTVYAHPRGHHVEHTEYSHPRDLKVESTGYVNGYKKEEEAAVDKRGYSVPSSYDDEYKKSSDEYQSRSTYSSPYGYEQSVRPMYEKQSYERPSYHDEPETHVERSYSSPVSAKRMVEIKPVMSEDYGHKDHTIDVKDDTPIVIHFRTHANRIRVEQTRIPEKPKAVEHTQSEDEPHRVVHEVYKPVIQEIREIIQPFRKVVQTVQPVVEEVQTVVHKSDGRRSRGGDSDDDGYGQKEKYSSGGNDGYTKRSSGRSNKKYNTIRDYLPQGSIRSAKGVPVYRSEYKGPAAPQKKH